VAGLIGRSGPDYKILETLTSHPHHRPSATLSTRPKTKNVRLNDAPKAGESTIGPTTPKPRHFWTRIVRCEYRITLILRSAGVIGQIPLPTSPQKCNSQQRARNPITGLYYPFCFKACPALRRTPAGPNVGGGRGTNTGTGLCNVSVYVPNVGDITQRLIL
jgi:hypothetical protein